MVAPGARGRRETFRGQDPHAAGLGRSGEGERPASPVDHTVNAILDMAVTLPAMKKLGEAVGVNLDGLMPEEEGRKR